MSFPSTAVVPPQQILILALFLTHRLELPRETSVSIPFSGLCSEETSSGTRKNKLVSPVKPCFAPSLSINSFASFQKVSKAEEGVPLAPAALAHWQHCSQMGKQTSKYWESLSPTSAAPGLRHLRSLTTCSYTAPVWK